MIFYYETYGIGNRIRTSLAYDIITKGHNGEIKIETKEGEGSKFIVIIPSTR
jgi:two-component system NtrC family sensor kinase